MSVEISHTASAADIENRSTYTFANQSIGIAAEDRDVVVGVVWSLNDAVSLVSATIAGESATIDVQQDAIDVNTQIGVALIRRRISSGTTADISFTLSTTAFRGAIEVYRITGAKTSVNDAQGAQGSSAPQNITLNVPENGGVIGMSAILDTNNVGAYTWTGLTKDNDVIGFDSPSLAFSSASDQFASPDAALFVEAESGDGGTNGNSIVGVSLAPPDERFFIHSGVLDDPVDFKFSKRPG